MILLIDDDEQMLKTIGDILQLHGYDSVSALSGHRGLEIAESSPTPLAVALVDLRLPDIDGIELVAKLRQISDATEIVIMTGNASVDSAVRALREQSYDYLIKPVRPDQLLHSIERAGERWQRRRAEAAMRESEERLRRVFEHVSDALFITDGAGRIIDANPAASDVMACQLDELRGRALSDLLRDIAPAPFMMDGATEPRAGRGADLSGEHRVRGADGDTRILDARSAAFAPGLVVHTVRDLTPQRRLEEELHHSQKMDAIGRLAGGVAHDFNNILTAIGCVSELVLATFDQSDQRRVEIEEIKKATRRAAALTRQLLAFSRKQMLQPRVFDLVNTIEDIERMLCRLIGEDVEFTTRMSPQLWLVRADPGQLEQVIMNLAINARDAMPNGGQLVMEATNLSLPMPRPHEHGVVPAGEYVVLRVRDTGSGMDAATRAQIFEPFFTTKAPGKGTGLGLSTAYGVIKQSGGHIVVDSQPGAGTTFFIYLPRADATTATADAAETPQVAGSGGATILLAEDDETIRSLARRILSGHGYRVLDASDGEHALRLATEHDAPIDLLLTDVVLSGMNGRELADQLRPNRQELRVLFISGYTDDEVVHRGVRNLKHSLLQKPFTPEELHRKVQEVLARPSAA